MPSIPQELLNSVVYLYRSPAEAEAGVREGGTGFITGVPSVRPELHYTYIATASHVVTGGARTARFNLVDGGIDAIEIPEDGWIHHPDGDDVVVAPISLDPSRYSVHCLPEGTFITKDILDEHFGPGDEAFYIGRFVTHEGKERNLPTVRFGNLAMLPAQRIMNRKRGILQESFLVEARSLSGYSGSPVFIFRWAYIDSNHRIQYKVESPYLFLGIDWSHTATYRPVLQSDKETLISEDWWVEQNSGMMGVVPAWKLREVLHVEELESARAKADKELAAQEEGTGEDVVLDSTETNDFERFQTLARKVVSVPKEKVQKKTD